LAADHVRKAGVLFRRQRYDLAIEACTAAIVVDPTGADAYRVRGQAYLAREKPDEAIRDFDRFLERKGKPDALFYRQRGLAKASRKDDAEDAVTDYSLALVLQPDAATYTARGWVYGLTGAWRLAQHDFQRAAQLDQKNGDAYNGLGYARVQLGHVQDGVRDAEEALKWGARTSRTVYKAARVYAQAAGHVSTQDRLLRERYLDSAIKLIREALDLEGPGAAAFWQKQIKPDLTVALYPLLTDVEAARRLRQLEPKPVPPR
jgi:tetratricopeptide (TPR) repeat protein